MEDLIASIPSLTPIKNLNQNNHKSTITTTTTINSPYDLEEQIDSDDGEEESLVSFGRHSPLLNTPGKDHISRRDTLQPKDFNQRKNNNDNCMFFFFYLLLLFIS